MEVAMSISPEVRSRQRAAHVVGWMYLATMASAISASAIRMTLIDYGDPVGTLANLRDSAGLFRLGIAVDLVTFAAIVVLPVAYYVLLAPVHRGLAMLGLSWRLAEAAVMFTLPFYSLAALDLVEGRTYLAMLAPETAEALIMLALRIYDHGFEMAMILLGLGSVVFNGLLYKARYVPRLLAGFGVAASIYLVAVTFAILLLPQQAATLRLVVFIPGTLGEITLGLWLALKGVSPPRA